MVLKGALIMMVSGVRLLVNSAKNPFGWAVFNVICWLSCSHGWRRKQLQVGNRRGNGHISNLHQLIIYIIIHLSLIYSIPIYHSIPSHHHHHLLLLSFTTLYSLINFYYSCSPACCLQPAWQKLLIWYSYQA